MAINNVTLMGRLTKAPDFEVIEGKKGDVSMCKFTIAVDRIFEDDTDFINCTAWGKTADFVDNYFDKGKMIALNGSLHVNTYEDDNGDMHWYTYVRVREVSFCGDKKTTDDTADNDKGKSKKSNAKSGGNRRKSR